MASNDDEKLKDQQACYVNKTLSEHLKNELKILGINACNYEKKS